MRDSEYKYLSSSVYEVDVKKYQNPGKKETYLKKVDLITTLKFYELKTTKIMECKQWQWLQ